MDVPEKLLQFQGLGHISNLPDEVLASILNMGDVKDVYHFFLTSLKLGPSATKIYLIKVIEKTFIYKEDLYNKPPEKIKEIFNLLFKPGHLYKLYKPTSGDIIHFPLHRNIPPYIPNQFVKIYSDRVDSGAALTSNGEVYIYGKFVITLLNEEEYPTVKYKIIQPPLGEKYVNVNMFNQGSYKCSCILLSNRGKCYGIGYNQYSIFGDEDVVGRDLTSPKEIFSGYDIKQVQLYHEGCLILTKSGEVFAVGFIPHLRVDEPAKSIPGWYRSPIKVSDISNIIYINANYNRFTFVSNSGEVYQSYSWLDAEFLKKWGTVVTVGGEIGLYTIPHLKDIIQVHSSRFNATFDRDYLIELYIFLDNQGHLHYFIIVSMRALRLAIGPHKLEKFRDIVRVFVYEDSYGFVNMNGEVYFSMDNYTSIESFVYKIKNPSLITLSPNLRAKDITIDQQNIYLLLQEK